MVVVVGEHSCVGKIMGKLQQEIEMTPLQEKLEKIAEDIGKLGMIAASVTVFVLFLRFFIEMGIRPGIGYNWSVEIGSHI